MAILRDLLDVLRALTGPPFEPLETVDIKFVSLETALLLALTSAKRVGDMQALSVSPSCLQFSIAGDSGEWLCDLMLLTHLKWWQPHSAIR